jgi:L-ribulose-5-phosphate 3-epimerase
LEEFKRKSAAQAATAALEGRRDFIKRSAAAGLIAIAPGAAHREVAGRDRPPDASRRSQPMRLGVIVGLGDDADATIASIHALGVPTCQLSVENDFSDVRAAHLRAALDRHAIEATAVDSLGPGEMVWDFYSGPKTIGIIPRATRAVRIDNLKRASDFARKCGIRALHTHCGFIPEDPNDPLYAEAIAAIHEVVRHCRENGQTFLYETGQETPITLLRAITDVGLDNQGVNLDVANLIMYGKANPLDALDTIGHIVRGMHAKDGVYPTDPRKLGAEVPIGEGKVDFAAIIARLKQLHYSGSITIEREISGPRQRADILRSKAYLQRLIGA